MLMHVYIQNNNREQKTEADPVRECSKFLASKNHKIRPNKRVIILTATPSRDQLSIVIFCHLLCLPKTHFRHFQYQTKQALSYSNGSAKMKINHQGKKRNIDTLTSINL